MIPEDRLKAAVVKASLGDVSLTAEIDKLLGKPWDDELETFRHAGDGRAGPLAAPGRLAGQRTQVGHSRSAGLRAGRGDPRPLPRDVSDPPHAAGRWRWRVCWPPASRRPRSRCVPGAAAVLVGAHNDTSTPFNLVSLPALIRHRYDGRGLRLTRVLARELAFTRYAVSYRSARLTVTGVMNVPNRPGRHPLVVIAHGWADPATYTSGSMLEREQAVLAANGFVAFQIDYRNYARSTREAATPVAHPLGYPEDLVNAVLAVRRARLSFVDTARIGLFGRSMGGGVVLDALVARPHLVRAAVLYAPVSAGAADDYERWVVPDPALRSRVTSAYGTPATPPRLWRQASSRAYLDRVAVPLQIHHGTADRMCPRALERGHDAGPARQRRRRHALRVPGEGHRFDRAWPKFMHRAVDVPPRRARLTGPSRGCRRTPA